MKITLERAFRLLEECSAVVTDSHSVIYPGFSDLDGSDENQFVYFSWQDGDGQDYDVACNEGENREVEINGSLMTLIDNEGEEFIITLLAPMDIEKELNNLFPNPTTPEKENIVCL